MADLHVQPKRKNNLWVWILIIVLLVAAAVYYFAVYKKDVPGTDRASLELPLQLAPAQLPLQPSIHTNQL